uniref:Uncharacterized protein n=1 Tax=Moniliophthora roreri TaxID=221103 RepID=A0A0W0FMJ6_MONRR
MASFVAAAVAPLSSRWTRKRRTPSSHHFDPERGDALGPIQTQIGPSSGSSRMSDAENFSTSPVATFGHGLQRHTSDVSERQLSRVSEETAEFDNEMGEGFENEGRDVEENDSDLEEELEEQGLYAGTIAFNFYSAKVLKRKFSGSYRRLLALYALTPVTFVILFIILALVPEVIRSFEDKETPVGDYPYAHYIPFPIPEVLVAGGTWSLCYLLNDLVLDLSFWLCNITYRLLFFSTHSTQSIPPPISAIPSILLSRAVYAAITVLLRLLTIPILLIPQFSSHIKPTWHDFAFRRVWWIGLGWAAFEAIAGIKQGYEGIALYKDVLVDVSMLKKKWAITDSSGDATPKVYGATRNASSSLPREASTTGMHDQEHGFIDGSSSNLQARGRLPRTPSEDNDDERQPLLGRGRTVSVSVDSVLLGLSAEALHESVETEVEKELDQLVAMRARDDLERVYGIPFVYIPVFISCLQRVNSLLLSIGFILVLSSTYILSVRPLVTPAQVNQSTPPPVGSLNSVPNYLAISLPLGIVLQFSLYLLHTQLILPRIGVHTVVYIGLLVSLGLFIAGLALWDAVA